MSILKLAPLPLAVLAFAATGIDPARNSVTVHEWGTFTSVAGADGGPIEWAPLTGKPDLPCFVHRLSRFNTKLSPATVRMETPVLYFYAPRPATVSVHVSFPQGWITEWYPAATRIRPIPPTPPLSIANGRAEWDGLEITPGDASTFPHGRGASRYYAARTTDAAPLRIGAEREKLIFYRGVGDIPIPLQALYSGDQLMIRNTAAEPIPLVILFENRSGRIAFTALRDFKNSTGLPTPEPHDASEVRDHLMDSLTGAGLYKKEAAAMLATWEDSWFEEGARLIYLVPRPIVDRAVPLEITPAPAAVERVFVGRIELLSPSVRAGLTEALAQRDPAALARQGRFLQPFLALMHFDWNGPAAATQAALNTAFTSIQKESGTGGCIE